MPTCGALSEVGLIGTGGANITEAQTVAAALAVAVHMHASANNLVSEGRAAEACTLTASALQSLGARLQVDIRLQDGVFQDEPSDWTVVSDLHI